MKNYSASDVLAAFALGYLIGLLMTVGVAMTLS
jgi:hypothetical protein